MSHPASYPLADKPIDDSYESLVRAVWAGGCGDFHLGSARAQQNLPRLLGPLKGDRLAAHATSGATGEAAAAMPSLADR